MKKRFALYGMFAAMAIFATACGDDSSSGPDEEESSSSIVAEDESSSSVEEEGKSSAKEEGKSSAEEKDAKSSSSEAKKGDSSSSEEASSSSSEAGSSSSEAGSSSSHYSTEPTCTVKTEGDIVTAEYTYYGTEVGDVKVVMVADYVKNLLTWTSQGILFAQESCAELETSLGKNHSFEAFSCSDVEKYYDVTINFEEGIENIFGTMNEFASNVCGLLESGHESSTEALNQEMLAAGKYGTFRDTRDAKLYRTIQIGDQTWMAQNLNYEPSSGSSCYEEDLESCHDYGRLYTWEAAQNACPTGWRLPTATEWDALLVTTMGADKGVQEMGGITITQYSGTGVSLIGGGFYTNSYGLSFVRGGFYGHPVMESSEYSSRDQSGAYWFGVEGNVSVATVYATGAGDGSALTAVSNVANKAFSVRCIKDDAPAQSISFN